jgi:hypothetical protein
LRIVENERDKLYFSILAGAVSSVAAGGAIWGGIFTGRIRFENMTEEKAEQQ